MLRTLISTDTYHKTRPFPSRCGTTHRAQVPRTVPQNTHARHRTRRTHATDAAHRVDRQRLMQHQAAPNSGRLDADGNLHTSGGRRPSPRSRGCKGGQAAASAKLTRGGLVAQTGKAEGRRACARAVWMWGLPQRTMAREMGDARDARAASGCLRGCGAPRWKRGGRSRVVVMSRETRRPSLQTCAREAG